MSKDLPVILVVDDQGSVVMGYEVVLLDKVAVIAAFTKIEADQMFDNNPEIKLVVMDACLGTTKPNTIELVRRMKQKRPTVPIIAASRDPLYRLQLVEAGCDANSSKIEVPHKVLELLGLV